MTGVNVCVYGDEEALVKLEGTWELLGQLPHTLQELIDDGRHLFRISIQVSIPAGTQLRLDCPSRYNLECCVHRPQKTKPAHCAFKVYHNLCVMKMNGHYTYCIFASHISNLFFYEAVPHSIIHDIYDVRENIPKYFYSLTLLSSLSLLLYKDQTNHKRSTV